MGDEPTFRNFWRAARQRWGETVTGARSASYIILAAILALADIVIAATLNEPLWLKILIGGAPPFLFFFIAFIYAVFSVWREERRNVVVLQKRLMPVLRLDFDQNSDGIVHVPTKIGEHDEHGRPVLDARGMQIISDSRGSYVRIRLTALTDTIVKSCSAFVIKIEKRNESGRFDFVRMPNAHRLTNAFVDVFPRVPQTVDFLQAGERDSKLFLSGGASFALLDAFNDIATYRVTINVIPQPGPDETITVEIDWRGQWNTISGREVQN